MLISKQLVAKLPQNLNNLSIKRLICVGISQKQRLIEYLPPISINEAPRTDKEWIEANDYENMPGPSIARMLMSFLPGGKLHNLNMIDMNRVMRESYGDIYRMKGFMGKPDFVFTYNPKDIELTYRSEGIWPIRIGLETFVYYRTVKRPDVFKGILGLISGQGQGWADIRNKVNPIMMKVQNVRQNLSKIDEIASDFIKKLEELREPSTHLLRSNFHDELKMWALESISLIALNKRLGLLTGTADPNAHLLAKNVSDFFQYSFEHDVQPSLWKFIETPGFKHLMRTYDSITNITTSYIEEAIKKFEAEGNVEGQSVLEKLCRIDKQVAVVMAIDMLTAGIDTTSSTFITLLYLLAKNPAKQEALREELLTLLPHKHTPLNHENTKNMPYLRACIKESLRIVPITPGNFRIVTRDVVLSGYRVPRGTGVLMGSMALANTETYFPRSSEFLPERWLKVGPTACPAAKATNPFVYLPFGFGPRTCIGKRIAEMEMETLLSKIVRNYRVSWNSENDLKYISNLVLTPHGDIQFKFEPVQY